MKKGKSDSLKQPSDKKIGLKIANLLRCGNPHEAVAYIEEGKKIGFEGFNHEFIDYLYNLSLDLAGQERASDQHSFFSTAELKEKLSHNLSSSFKKLVNQREDHKYHKSDEIKAEEIIDKLLSAKSVAEQEKILPYKGKIYLPTEKYSEAEQVEAINKTAAFLSSINARATHQRLQTLRNLIKESCLDECVIVANGPSLKSTNIAMLENVFIIGLNSIFLHPYITPHVIVCEDHLVGEDRSNELNDENRSIKVIPGYLTYCVNPDDLTIVLNHRPRVSFPVDIDFSDDADSITYTGGTVTYTAIQLAISLGFKCISLVGVDASYKVENVKEQNNYATGILESLGEDPNHFNSGYFGKGYRWHDPNPLRMMQAYSVANRYAESNGVNLVNLTRGGMLDVFKREDYLNKIYSCYPKLCVIDWIDINSKAATGEVKRALFKEWPKDKLLHVYSPKPTDVGVFKSSPGDIFIPDHSSILPAWKAVIENNPSHFYWRPTHNRPLLNLYATLLFILERKPYALHLMDYWTTKVPQGELRQAYEKALEESIGSSAHFFVISQRMKDRLCAKYKLQSKNVTVAHNYSPAFHDLNLKQRPTDDTQRVIFYSGNLDPEQSIDPLIDICNAVNILNSKGSIRYKFIIRTSESHIKASSHRFSLFDFVALQVQSDTFNEYIEQMAKADVCILCYGFGSDSQAYLLDSMANKLPDLITAKSKFYAYGDPEIGTLSYLKSINYPFIDFNREPRSIAKNIEKIAAMDYATYSEACKKPISDMANEFSEMAQCHVFQQQLATCLADEEHNNFIDTNYSSLVNQYQHILKLSNVTIPKGLEQELRLMQFLANHQELIQPIYKLVREHGLSWSVNSTRNTLEKAIKNSSYDNSLAVQSLSWMISSQRHSRFAELWDKLFDLIIKD